MKQFEKMQEQMYKRTTLSQQERYLNMVKSSKRAEWIRWVIATTIAILALLNSIFGFIVI